MYTKPKSLLSISISTIIMMFLFASCGAKQSNEKASSLLDKIKAVVEPQTEDIYHPENAIIITPHRPQAGDVFKVITTGGSNIKQAKVLVRGASSTIESQNVETGQELPCWRVDEFTGQEAGKYTATLMIENKEVCNIEFNIGEAKAIPNNNKTWQTTQGWDAKMETLYSAWVNALFRGSNEQSSWTALHEVTQIKERNFLHNHLMMNEDDADAKIKVVLEPDCADNPFLLRAYFAWKLALPFAYHLCDRGYVGKNPTVGQMITNETTTSKTNTILAFNSFARRIMDGVHSGTARTALNNENADYYPLSLTRQGLRPGAVFADPYGHTLIVVSWQPQTKNNPGLLLAIDAQPDKSVAIKRFWKGNFLFNTSGVVGEPGFKAFRPITVNKTQLTPLSNDQLNGSSGFAPFSLQQKQMAQDTFYLAMERLINPQPLDPEAAMVDLIKALHEQLMVRVKSVDNGEKYMREHPGATISMPSNANGVFLTGGLWEDYSTPNRDLRLLIAIDAVLNFPNRVAQYPQDFKISKSTTPDDIRMELKALLDKKVTELTITYTRTDGTPQQLTIGEILHRRDAFEMAYNPNDGAEIRWGAPEKSQERSTCKRQSPQNQQKTMQAVRKWFISRLHPPT